MKKSILNLAGAQELSKKEQKTISGGIPINSQPRCYGNHSGICPGNMICLGSGPIGGPFTYHCDSL